MRCRLRWLNGLSRASRSEIEQQLRAGSVERHESQLIEDEDSLSIDTSQSSAYIVFRLGFGELAYEVICPVEPDSNASCSCSVSCHVAHLSRRPTPNKPALGGTECTESQQSSVGLPSLMN